MSSAPSHPASAPERTPLRADAEANRARMVLAAREAFAAKGIDVPMATVARRAGVGLATLYRRFPSRDALIAEVFAGQLRSCQSLLDDALSDPDPWRGLSTALRTVCAMQAQDRGFSAMILSRFPDAAEFESKRQQAQADLATLVHRAQESGQVRADVDASDIILLLLANDGVIRAVPHAATSASRRLVGHFLRSAEARGDARLLPPPAPLAVQDVLAYSARRGAIRDSVGIEQ